MYFDFLKEEEKILKFWEDHQVFKKSLDKNKKRRVFVFYEGPPTANGRPGIHHILVRSFKDAICRFKTMEGFYVERKAGWDTHGLPVEIEVEKEIGVRSKKDIEKYGIDRFNQKCKRSVWKYKEEWENLTRRIGFWLDIKNPYITYTPEYIETLFLIIKKFYQKGLLYEDKKIVPWCPRCQTSLSSHEVAQGYKRIKEPAIYVKFEILDLKKFKIQNSNSKIYFLVWTTTPWTLPANIALAINPEIAYVLVELKSPKLPQKNERYILARARLKQVFPEGGYEILKEFKGRELKGLKYKPLYSLDPKRYQTDAFYRVLPGDFVSVDEGTGIVHIAPAFGEDDFNLIKKEKIISTNEIPVTVEKEGTMEKGIIGEGKFVKEADPLIIEDLRKRTLLFKEELYEHDYPFCWRCKTPLLYYLYPCWFVRVSRVRKKLIENNEKINWIPSYLKHGRFGNFLKQVQDWNFSRERYWGTPLPVWRCEKCGKIEVIGSRRDLRKQKFSNNRYFLLRHGLAENNVKGIVSDEPDKYPLTALGKIQAKRAAKKLKKEGIDIILSSDISRCKETAKIIGKELNIKPQFFKELREIKLGVFNGHSVFEYRRFFYEKGERFYNFYKRGIRERKFYKKPEGGETWQELKMRMYNFLKKIDKKYQNKKILIISHEDPLVCLQIANEGILNQEYEKTRLIKKNISQGEYLEMKLNVFPYNDSGELDFHRPYIDEVEFFCPKCQGKMKRVNQVVDCWFDSGAMPIAQNPKDWILENDKLQIPKSKFPADFICEAVDQTRGWFYTLLAVSTLLGFGPPYKNVISLGLVLDEKGEKMSKSRGNVVNPWEMINRYGADALRWYFYTINQPGEPKLFKEKDIKRGFNKFILTFYNSFLFYKTYAYKAKPKDYKPKVTSVLDKWILSRLEGLILEVKDCLDRFDIVSSTRAIERFTLEDLSNWYIRRSRSRFQMKSKQRIKEKLKDLKRASETLGFILLELSKLCASFIPFLSETIYQGLIREKGRSVHLEDFPKIRKKLIDRDLEEKMTRIREIVRMGLLERKKAGIKVRQPLSAFKVRNSDIEIQNELLNLIKEELNVKKVILEKGKGELKVELDTKITPELKKEGILREVIRTIQEMRKDGKLTKEDEIKIFFDFPKDLAEIVRENEKFIREETFAIEISERKETLYLVEREFKLDNQKCFLAIKKI